MPDLLLELFSEEIPARMQARAAADLARLLTDGLREAGLEHGAAESFSTPRRLVLRIEGLASESPMVREERKGPRADAPEKALEGFLRSTGLTKDQLELRDDKKGQTYFAVIERPGRAADAILAELIPGVIRNFPWPKSMRWGAGSLRWVRPLHSVLAILHEGDAARVVEFEIEGLASGDTTEAHRFMASGEVAGRFAVTSFDDYRAKLRAGHVILSASERAEMIEAEARKQAEAAGLELVEDKGLLAEVAGLVEWPVVLMGEIGEDFLGLPPEVLQTSMKEHQKFFSVRNPATWRIERFITVANRETADKGATILAGNAKVLAARLADAKFFWENDIRVAEAGGEEWLTRLGNVTFHNKLGSVGDQITRIAALAREIAPLVGADADLAEQAARWAKADLSSEMVYEFPELQGLMGRYYAAPAGKPEEVALAAEEHYAPLGPSDDVPSAPVSIAVALAAKIDTLTGFWAIDEKPTGSKDPFALRRAALGIIRLVLENDVRVSLLKLLADANQIAGPRGDSFADVNDLITFFHDRLKVYLRDQGIRHDVIDACLAMDGNDDLTLLVKRARALSEFLGSEDGTNLVQGYKRAANILAQAEAKDGVEYRYGADAKFAETGEEKALFAALAEAGASVGQALESEDFSAAMAGMASLRAPIDAFFEAVQVNAENEILRRNRLNLLYEITSTCEKIADLGRLEG